MTFKADDRAKGRAKMDKQTQMGMGSPNKQSSIKTLTYRCSRTNFAISAIFFFINCLTCKF